MSDMAQSTLIEVQFDSNTVYISDTAVRPSIPAAVETIARNPVAVERYRVGKSSVP